MFTKDSSISKNPIKLIRKILAGIILVILIFLIISEIKGNSNLGKKIFHLIMKTGEKIGEMFKKIPENQISLKYLYKL